MKFYLGILENSAPHQTRIFGEIGGKLVDLNRAYACYLSQVRGENETADERASFYFPPTIAAFFERGEPALQALDQVVSLVGQTGIQDFRGPRDEKLVYDLTEIRILPPLQRPEKSIVIGFADQARIEAMPKAEIPTGFYKLPSTFVASGDAIVWPKFSEEIDCDACLAVVIGKSARRISGAQAWNHIAGFTLLLDVTARDINRREGLTKNNLLGKNFPSSTSLGPAVLLKDSKSDLEALEISLTVDGAMRQRFSPRECVFSLEEIIARWSLPVLKPGDVLAIGGSLARQADRLLSPAPVQLGSSVRCSSPRIGELSHRVVSTEDFRR